MGLRRLRIESFRCLGEVELELHPERNFLFGPNGAGKTSILESIHFLGRGRSFRTRQNRGLIQQGARGFSVYGEVRTDDGQIHRIGVAYTGTGIKLRQNGSPVRGIAELARTLPVHVIEPGMHLLIEGGPRERRRFLDWGVFHVEQGYLAAWRRYRRVLGQRNAALKANATGAALAGWTEALAEVGDIVDRARRDYVKRMQGELGALGRQLLAEPLQIEYRPGWRAGVDLAQALMASESGDRAQGTTQVGPHRADLVVNLGAGNVREAVSRGQQKLVAAALVMTQVQVFGEERGHAGVLLVDDPAAELDEGALGRFMAALDGLSGQRVLTGLTEAQLPPAEGFPVFHVEQGKVAAVV